MTTVTNKKIKDAIARTEKNNLPKELFAERVWFDHQNKLMEIKLRNGYWLVFTLNEFPVLKNAAPQQRMDYELIAGGAGIHWAELDEDLSVSGLIKTYINNSKLFIQRNEALVA